MKEWCAARGREPGAVLALEQVWALAQAWYGDRLHREFRGRSAEKAEAILRGVGLGGPFWSLSKPPGW